MLSSSPARTPKLQGDAEQPSTGECWIPPKQRYPTSKVRRRLSKMFGGGEIAFRIKPHAIQRHSEGLNKTLCAPGDPMETEPDLPLSV